MELNRLESLFKKFGIDNMMSLSMFFFSFQKIEYILGIFFEKYQKYGDDNTDNDRKKDDKCSHIPLLSNKYRYTINIVESIK